jgi:mannose-6-phosphate isomerase-like protein (cupin superfamily)
MTEPVIGTPGQAISASGVSFEIREWAHGPNDGPRLHVHHSDDEAWHVLEGALRFRFSDSTTDVGPGVTVFAPAGVAHTYGNPGPGDVRYLIISTARVFALIEAMHDNPTEDELRAICQEFDSDVLE